MLTAVLLSLLSVGCGEPNHTSATAQRSPEPATRVAGGLEAPRENPSPAESAPSAPAVTEGEGPAAHDFSEFPTHLAAAPERRFTPALEFPARDRECTVWPTEYAADEDAERRRYVMDTRGRLREETREASSRLGELLYRYQTRFTYRGDRLSSSVTRGTDSHAVSDLRETFRFQYRTEGTTLIRTPDREAESMVQWATETRVSSSTDRSVWSAEFGPRVDCTLVPGTRLPLRLESEETVTTFEYDEQGHLLGWSRNVDLEMSHTTLEQEPSGTVVATTYDFEGNRAHGTSYEGNCTLLILRPCFEPHTPLP